MTNTSARALLRIVTPSASVVDEEIRLEQRNLQAWLEDQRTSQRVTLYGSAYDRGTVSVFTALVPAPEVDMGNEHAFTSWSGNPFDAPGCGLVYGGGEPPRVELSPPPFGAEQFYPGARAVVHGRSFDGRSVNKTYYELSHELTLPHGLHWLEEREAWCRLNNTGDVVDIARIERLGNPDGGRGSAKAITMDREVLNLHLAATDSCLIQMFDSVCMTRDFSDWRTWNDTVFKDTTNGLILKFRKDSPGGSFFRGAQVIRPPLSSRELGAALYAAEHSPKEYATFITQDFKNRRISEVSCAPEAIASYFDGDSSLPFQTSPVFFRPDVLDKYKADPDKYRLEDRTIGCRNAWHLQTYDVNEAGQVHTYIKYLGDLPYSEQIYWKAFNERPKGSISRRAYQTDFEGEFDDQPNGIRALKHALNHLEETRAGWFVLREPSLLEQLHYPLTPSTKAWGEGLTTLAKCVVEGLEKSFFVAGARSAGIEGDARWGSLKWLREYLGVRGVDADRVSEICDPLVTLQHLRTKLNAHAGGNEAASIRRDLLKKYGSPRQHIHELTVQLADSLEAIETIAASPPKTA